MFEIYLSFLEYYRCLYLQYDISLIHNTKNAASDHMWTWLRLSYQIRSVFTVSSILLKLYKKDTRSP